MSDIGEFLEANRGIDVVSQHTLSSVYIPCKETLNTLTKKLSAKSRIALHSGANCFFEISCQSHYFSPSFFLGL